MTGWNAGHKLDDGRYTIKESIGEGGFGLTYLGQDSKGNYVVIKTINEKEIPKNFLDKIRRDFVTEALNLAKCDIYPHVVKCVDFIPDNRFPCIVMEYIPGDNIEKLMNKKGTLSEAEALTYIRQVAEGLKGVHTREILHRDIKPANIIIHQQTQEAVLIDFGIARQYTPDVTAYHTQMYSPGYSPIEQIYPDDQDNKPGFYTDVYGLAATLYFMLTGVSPEDAGRRSYESLSRKIDPLKVPNEINPNISDNVTKAIMKGLAMSPKYRSQTIEHWMKLLPDLSSNASVNNASPSSQNPIASPSPNIPSSPPVIAQSQPQVKQPIPSQPPVIGKTHPQFQVQQKTPNPVVNKGQNQPIRKRTKQPLNIKFISLGILGLLGLTGVGFYLFNSPSQFNLLASPCPSTYDSESSSKVINVCNTNYRSDGIIPGLSGNKVALTPDNEELITYGSGRTIKVWNLATGELLRTLDGHSNRVRSVAISNDGQTIVSGSRDDTIKVWNLATGELLRTLDGHSYWVSSVAISNDGQTIVSGSGDTDIRVWRNQL